MSIRGPAITQAVFCDPHGISVMWLCGLSVAVCLQLKLLSVLQPGTRTHCCLGLSSAKPKLS